MELTFGQRYGDDDSIAGADPQSVGGDHQSRDPDKRETQLPCACNREIQHHAHHL